MTWELEWVWDVITCPSRQVSSSSPEHIFTSSVELGRSFERIQNSPYCKHTYGGRMYSRMLKSPIFEREMDHRIISVCHSHKVSCFHELLWISYYLIIDIQRLQITQMPHPQLVAVRKLQLWYFSLHFHKIIPAIRNTLLTSVRVKWPQLRPLNVQWPTVHNLDTKQIVPQVPSQSYSLRRAKQNRIPNGLDN